MKRPSLPSDHLDAALDASCGTLITLQSILTSARPVSSVQPQLTGAIDSLRQAIKELRLLRAQEGDWLAFDFVLADSTRSPDAPHRSQLECGLSDPAW
jgi:hypothetical protein